MTLPVSGSTSTSHRCVAKPGPAAGTTRAAWATIGPPLFIDEIAELSNFWTLRGGFSAAPNDKFEVGIDAAYLSALEEFDRPIALEFLYCYEQMNLGLTAEAALRELGRRTGLLEVRIFVLSVVVHRQTGGQNSSCDMFSPPFSGD